jgi:glutaredoxin
VRFTQIGYSRSMPAFSVIRSGFHARVPASILAVGAALSLCGPAWALYKVVGPDGKVTYTDRAPVDQPSQHISKGGVVSSGPALPYELQQVAARYPVVLYTMPECGLCDKVRTFLRGRGVPFAEKLVVTPADAAALSKAESTTSLPVGRIGQQQLLGFNAGDWARYLDAAGYPKTSALPAGYAWPAATPLTPPAASAAPREARPGDTRVRNVPVDPVAPAPSADNPAGIRF